MDNKMTHQNTLLTQTKMCPKGFDDEQVFGEDILTMVFYQ